VYVRTFMRMFLAGALLLASGPAAFSAEKVVLKPGAERPDARGEAVVRAVGADQQEVAITMRGLRPDAVYTVWLVNEKPRMSMAGLGKADYTFTTDAKGQGRYAATIASAELAKWHLLKIAYHPDRKPRNMRNIVIDLEGTLR
jgi:hypothetical protein